MATKKPSTKLLRQATAHNDNGLALYAQWQIEDAIAAFQAAIAIDVENPEYHLNLARAFARGTRFDEAMASLGEYLRTETDENLVSRYERLFSSALDDVETALIAGMRKLKIPLEQIGKAIQMWLEYRITIGRRPLRTPRPELWAAGLTNAVCRVNFAPVKLPKIAQVFGIGERAVKEKYEELVETLDIMPADYRYFTGEENPLDKLVEAAQQLDELYDRFEED